MYFTIKFNSFFLACIILFIINLTILPPQVKCDMALVHKVCNHTPYPKECEVCFNQSSAEEMTMFDLAGESMYCTFKMSSTFKQAMDNLAAKNEDSKSKDLYEGCASNIYNFGVNMMQAQGGWYQHSVEVSKKSLDDAKNDYDKCDRAVKLRLPSDVDAIFKGLGNFYNDTYDILLQYKQEQVRHSKIHV